MQDKRKPIRKASKKRSAQLRKYSTLRINFLTDKECEAKLEGCSGMATDVHHMEGREGERLLDMGKCKAVCRSCHKIIEENPHKAKALGLSITRHRILKF